MSKFSAQHYNAIAKDIREELSYYIPRYEEAAMFVKTEALVKLALRFTKRFQADNERFDPKKFLDACSPNKDKYPLSELWNDSTFKKGK